MLVDETKCSFVSLGVIWLGMKLRIAAPTATVRVLLRIDFFRLLEFCDLITFTWMLVMQLVRSNTLFKSFSREVLI